MSAKADAAPAPAPAPTPASALERLLLFDAVEASYDITSIEGSLPRWVRGSYYVIGPARFQRGSRRCRHWLDGDGFVCALHFSDGGVRFAGRFVQTRKLRDEEAAGALLYRSFGTAFPGDRLRRNVMIESPINVNVCHFGKRLLALGEQSLPVELDPQTLETKGEFDFGGELNEVTPFSAHAKLDPSSRRLLNFGISYAAARPVLNVYELGQRAGLIRRARVPLDLPYANHDFAFTGRHAAFFLSPLTLDFSRFLGGASIMDSLAWQPEKGSQILVLPRAKGEKPFAVPAGEGYCLHLINAFERDGALVCDILELEAPVYGDYRPLPELFCVAPSGGPVRYVVDLERRTLKTREPLSYASCCDFPAVDAQLLGRTYRDFWLLGISSTGARGPKFFDHLAHGSWATGEVSDVYRAPAGTFLGGEPAFVGNPRAPGEGFVIVQELNAGKGESAFLMFDAFDVRRGPLIRLPLKQQVHPLFHAAYYPAHDQAL